MKSIEQMCQDISKLTIERDINLGGIKSVRQLLIRAGKADLPNSIFIELHNVLKARKSRNVPMFHRTQAF